MAGIFLASPRRDSAGADQSANIRKNESSALGFFIGIQMNDDFEKVFEKLQYDPETGIFTWIESPSNKCKLGSVAGSYQLGGYRQITVSGTTYAAHRLAWRKTYGEWPKFQVDHVNSVRDDNRIANLRLATSSQNMHNPLRTKAKNKTSRFMGVSFLSSRSRWIAQIKLGGETRRIGSFVCEQDAADAYSFAKKALLTSLFDCRSASSSARLEVL